LLDWLRRRNGVRIIGNSGSSAGDRVPTIAFILDGRDPAAVVKAADGHKLGIRHGDFHSRRLIEALGLAPNGVIRVSMVHYNTSAEIGRLIGVLDGALI
jgi:selenocysteine lyase/cysteine desulfurase